MKNEYEYLNDVKIDFLIYEEKTLSEKEKRNMKNIIKKNRKFPVTKVAGIAACFLFVCMLSQTTFAKSIFYKIIKEIKTGYNTIYQVEYNGGNKDILPTESKDGFYEYTSGDSKVVVSNAGELDIKEVFENASKGGKIVIKDKADINNHINFEAKIPESLPDNFEFYGATVYEGSGDYLNIYYRNVETNEYFIIFERLLSDETAFEAGTNGEVKEVKINDVNAVVMDNVSLLMEVDGISVDIAGRGFLSYEELVNTAKSLK